MVVMVVMVVWMMVWLWHAAHRDIRRGIWWPSSLVFATQGDLHQHDHHSQLHHHGGKVVDVQGNIWSKVSCLPPPTQKGWFSSLQIVMHPARHHLKGIKLQWNAIKYSPCRSASCICTIPTLFQGFLLRGCQAWSMYFRVFSILYFSLEVPTSAVFWTPSRAQRDAHRHLARWDHV